MIEVEMRVDHDVDVLWIHAVIEQAFRQVRAVQRENVAPLGVPFISRAGFNQNGFAPRANQQTIHRQRDPVTGVGRHFLFPHGLRDDAEHRPAIKPQMPIHQNVKFQLPQLQGLSPSPARARI